MNGFALNVEIINTGSELLAGRTLNRHQQWLCQRLSGMGHRVQRQMTVSDTATEIVEGIRESLQRVGLIILTGGLGPTSDDRTREAVAEMLGLALEENAEVLSRLEEFFAKRNLKLPPSTRIQAQVPEGATVFVNEHGTAPGLAVEIPVGHVLLTGDAAAWLIMLPGPPRELHPMFDNQIAPFLREKCAVDFEFASRTLRVTGIGESAVEERVAIHLGELIGLGLELGYCAKPGEVDVRLSFRGERAQQRLMEAQGIVMERLGPVIFAEGETLLEEVVVRLLREKGKTLATAESCTGGHISNRITNVSGASEVFLAGLVTYSNAAKMKFLGVRTETLEANGAVSETVAREMVEGLKRETGADFAISTTGIAGPTGGTADKSVGTVFVGLATPTAIEVHKFLHPFDRETFKNVTAQRALDLVRKKLGL